MAGRIALDLKQFKHVKSDDKSTTLCHKDGHQLTLAHGALSKEGQAQLASLAKMASEEQQPEQMAEGGKVKKPSFWDKTKNAFVEEPKPYKKPVPIKPPRETDPKGSKAISDYFNSDEYAEGGQIPQHLYEGGDYTDQLQQAEPEPMMSGIPQSMAPEAETVVEKPALEAPPNLAADRFQELKQQFPNQPDEVILRTIKREQNEQIAAAQNSEKIAASKQEEQNTKVSDQETYAAQIAQRKQQMGVPLSPEDQAALQLANNKVLAAGPPPQAGPATAPAKEPEVQVQEAPQQQPQSPADMMESGYQSKLAGINQEAKAQSDLAKANESVLNNQIIAQNEAKLAYKAQYDALEQERQAHMQDIRDAHVDPNKYWTGDANGNGSHSKIMAGIGMIIAGFNPTTQPNAAINFIKHQMEMNIQAQKENLGSKQNLLSANLRQFGNLQDATTMTRLMQSDIVHNQLLQEAAKAKTPMAKAAALQAAGDLKMTYAPMQQQFAARRTIGSLTAAAQADPTKIPTLLTAMESVDPKKAAEMRERLVPDIGFASTPEGAKGMREMGTTVSTVKQSIDRLKAITKQGGKSLSPNARAEADTLRSMLIGQLRVPITGPGAMSEGERALLERSVPDVTALFSLDSSSIKRLDTVEAKVVGQYKNMARMNGLNIPGSAQSNAPAPKFKSFKPIGK